MELSRFVVTLVVVVVLGLLHGVAQTKPRTKPNTQQTQSTQTEPSEPSLAETTQAHAALAVVKLYYSWDLPGSAQEARRAIELNPGYATAHHVYVRYLSIAGQHGDAIAEIKRAQELDPLSPILYAVAGDIFNEARDYDSAIEQNKKALDLVKME